VFICVDNTTSNAVWTQIVSTNISTANPTSSDDTYEVGSFWFNETTRATFICADNTHSSAVWSQLGTSHYTDRNPTANDDEYNLGTVWVNSDTDRIFICAANDAGAAVWKELTTSGATFVESVVDTVDPTSSDDTYDIGTIWVNTTTDQVFVCTDGTSSAAVWKNLTDNTDEAIFRVGTGRRYTTIQSAVTALETYLSTSGNKGYVSVAPGTYNESLTFASTSSILVHGEADANMCILSRSGNYSMITDSAAVNVTFRNFGFQLTATNNTNSIVNSVSNGASYTFQHCKLQHQNTTVTGDSLSFKTSQAGLNLTFDECYIATQFQVTGSGTYNVSLCKTGSSGTSDYHFDDCTIDFQIANLQAGSQNIVEKVADYDVLIRNCTVTLSTGWGSGTPSSSTNVIKTAVLTTGNLIENSELNVQNTNDVSTYIFNAPAHKCTATLRENKVIIGNASGSICNFSTSDSLLYMVEDFVYNTASGITVFSNTNDEWIGSYFDIDAGKRVHYNNLAATHQTNSDPTVNDDSYDLGTLWINTSTNEFFVCADNSTGAAVWKGSNDFNFDTEVHTITGGEATSKSFTLAHTPLSVSDVTVMIIGSGSVQEYGVDYTITTNTFSWTGLGLDGVLTTGDKVFLSYFY
jgi:hypothetical protein